MVDRFLNRNPGIYRRDIAQIVHIADMDGCYVDRRHIRRSDDRRFVYRDDEIRFFDPQMVIDRNEKKQRALDRLSRLTKVGRIPYVLYYFSCNQEHVLHGTRDVSDNSKRRLAYEFSDRFYGCEEEFVDFIRQPEIAVPGDYDATWDYIRRGTHSLQRNSNFHLLFGSEVADSGVKS